MKNIIKKILCFFLAVILMVPVMDGIGTEKEEITEVQAAVHTHNANCYASDVALHKHYTTNAKNKNQTSTDARRSSGGGCYTVYHAGSSSYRTCSGDGNWQDIRWSSYTSSLQGGSCSSCGASYSSWGGSTPSNSPSYPGDTGTGLANATCSSCGKRDWGTSYWTSTATWNCRCGSRTGGLTSPPGPHEVYESTPAYYTPGCGKDTSVYYDNYGDGNVATPICDRAVVSIVPNQSSQTIMLGGTVNALATVTYKDGHTQANVECTLVSLDYTKLNQWQQATISFGQYNADSTANTSVIKTGAKTATINVFIQGEKNFSVSADSTIHGAPTYQRAGETTESTSGKAIIGTTVTLNKKPKTGYQFAYWTDGSGNVVNTTSSPVKLLTDTATQSTLAMPAYDYTLVAHYEGKVVNITYDFNGGKKGGRTSKTVTGKRYGNTYGEMPYPVKTGAQLQGFYLEGDATEKLVSKYDIIRLAYDHKLIAKWAEDGPAYFQAEYDDLFPVLADGYLKGYHAANGTLPKSWYMEEEPWHNGTGMNIVSGSTIIKYRYNFSGRQIIKNRAAYIIYARWQPNVYKVTFVCGENIYLNQTAITGANGQAVTYNSCTPRGGFRSNGAEKYVMYDMLFGTFPTPLWVNPDGSVDYSVSLVWSTKPDGSNDPDSIITSDMTVDLDGDITLYAVRGEAAGTALNVILNANGGLHNSVYISPSGLYRAYYNTYTKLVTFTKNTGDKYGPFLGFNPVWSGHTFTGWELYADGSGRKQYTDADIVMMRQSHVLYAQWEHYVNYDVNDRDINGNVLSNVENTDWFGFTNKNTFINSDYTAQNVKNNGFVRPGYRFVGWNTARNGSGTWYTGTADKPQCRWPYASTTISATRTITLYAQWDGSGSLTFDYRGGTDGAGQSEYTVATNYNGTIPALSIVPAKDGYTFMGYYTGTRGTGEQVYAADGSYCYARNDIVKLSGRVKLINDNYASIGDTANSALISGSSVPWPQVDRLYAYWKLNSVDGETNINFDLVLSSPDYDVDTAIPTTETIDVTGTIPKFLLSTTNSRGEEVYFDLSTPVRIQYENDDETLVSIVVPSGTTPVRTIYLETLGSIHYAMVRKVDVMLNSDWYNMVRSGTECIYVDYAGTVPAVANIEDATLASLISIDEDVEQVETYRNDKYTATYRVLLSNGEIVDVTCDEDYIITLTPVASDVTASSVSSGDGTGTIVLNSLIKPITVIPSNTYAHISAKGYGTRSYIYSMSGKMLLVPLTDRKNGQSYDGNVVAFEFPVWEDVTGNGLSSDDIYYAKGTNIPIGTAGRVFYIPSSTDIGKHMIAFASLAVNISDGNIFRLDSNGKLILANAALTQVHANTTFNNPATGEDESKYSAYSSGNYIVKSSINAFDVYYTNLNYDNNVNSLNDYSREKGVTLPGTTITMPYDGKQSMLLKLGYNFDYRILTSGGFMGDNAKLKVVPKYELVDESFNLVDANPQLYYMAYDASGTKQYVVSAATDTSASEIKLSDSILQVPTGVINYSNNLKALDFTNPCEIYNYREITLNSRARLYNDYGNILLPSGMGEAKLRLSQQAWYGTFRVPGDLRVTKASDPFNSWTSERQTSEVIYGYSGFVKDGYLKVTFTIEGYDDLYGVEPGWAALNYTPSVTVYYDLDAKIGDDYGAGGIVTH